MQNLRCHEPSVTYSSGQVFESDEMKLAGVEPNWSEEDFLDQEGIFYLKDVANKLEIPSSEIKKRALAMERSGKSAWLIMGVRKTWTHWIVRMTVFSKYFESMAPSRIRRVDPNWDSNFLLAQKGRFFLSDVCEKLPFTADQIRYQARHNAKSKQDFGVWKEQRHKSYLVDMEVFSKWIRRVWNSGLNVKTGQPAGLSRGRKARV